MLCVNSAPFTPAPCPTDQQLADKLLTAATLILMPVMIGCQVWVHRLFRTPLTAEELKKSGIY